MATDLLNNQLTGPEQCLLRCYHDLKALCDQPDLPPIMAANVRASVAVLNTAVCGLGLAYEHLSDIGV